jgi:gluconolactonase
MTAGTGGNGGSGAAGGNGGNGGSTGGSGTAAAAICPAGATYAGSPVPAGATPARIAAVPPKDAFNNNGSNSFNIEGLVWSGGALYMSEILAGANPPPARILELTLPGTVTVVTDTVGTNGLALDGAGGLYGASHVIGGIIHITLPSGAFTNVVTSYGGARFDAPNDLAVRADGNLYFSDPDYQAATPRPQQATRVYRIAPGATTATVIDATRREPNGVTLSLDERTLYVAGSDGIFAYPVAANGDVGAGTRFSTVSGDGMVMDCAGNLYVASGTGVQILDPTTGAQVASIAGGRREERHEPRVRRRGPQDAVHLGPGLEHAGGALPDGARRAGDAVLSATRRARRHTRGPRR